MLLYVNQCWYEWREQFKFFITLIQQILERSNASLLETEERVTFAEAAANLTEIRDTFHDSEALLKDVEEAKGKMPLLFLHCVKSLD